MSRRAGLLRWRCRRGAKELDVLLSAYLDHCYAGASPAQQQTFEHLLELPDPELMELLFGTKVTDDPAIVELVTTIRDAANH